MYVVFGCMYVCACTVVSLCVGARNGTGSSDRATSVPNH